MNAKFEKWFYENNMETLHALGVSDILMENDDGSYVQTWVQKQFDAWQAALQSLEVTPELVLMGASSYMEEDTVPENWQPCPADIRRMRSALTAVFNAIKEQSNG